MRARGRFLPAMACAAAVLVFGLSAGLTYAESSHQVAIIVHPGNGCPDPSLEELRAIFTLRRQFWENGRRIVLILPASNSVEKEALLKTVYRLSAEELRKDWARRLFAGEIPAVPSSIRSSETATAAVRRVPGAISAVPAKPIPSGVRVLAIAGKRPGEPGYTLEDPGAP